MEFYKHMQKQENVCKNAIKLRNKRHNAKETIYFKGVQKYRKTKTEKTGKNVNKKLKKNLVVRKKRKNKEIWRDEDTLAPQGRPSRLLPISSEWGAHLD